MTKAEIIEYLYDNHVRADITLEEMADDLSVEPSAQLAQDSPITCTDTFYKQDAVNVLEAERETLYHNIRSMGKPCDQLERYVAQYNQIGYDIYTIQHLPSAQPMEDARAMCGECDAWNQYKNYPSAQPVDKDINVPDNDTISRQGVLRLLNAVPSEEFATKAMLISGVKALPSSQPDLDEWCRDCKEYDKERHSCPRWNRVIRHTVEDIKAEAPERKRGKWIEFPNLMAYKCSECGRIIQTTDGRRNVSRHYPFCHCGADMRGDGNG